MKKIEAIFQQSKLTEVVASLHRHGFDGMTVTEAHALCRYQQPKVANRGREIGPPFVPRHKIDLIVGDSFADEGVDAVYQAAQTTRRVTASSW